MVVRGSGAHAPQEGDRPQVWVEVDTTPPTIRLLGIESDKDSNARHLTILWRASDKNLAPHPVNIAYATQQDGPWSVVAGKLENTGRYVWTVPPEMPRRFFVRVEAADAAGNVSSTQAPANLIQPTATIIAVGGHGN
jgi:hypothetical protein